MLILDGGLDGGSLTRLPPLTDRTAAKLLRAVHDGEVFWIDYDQKSYVVNRYQPNLLLHDVTTLAEDWAARNLIRLAQTPGSGRRVWMSTRRSVALMQTPDLPCQPSWWRDPHDRRVWRWGCDSWHPGGTTSDEAEAVAAAAGHVDAVHLAADRASTRAVKAAADQRHHDNHWGRAVTCGCRRAGVECHCYSDDFAGLPTTTSDGLWWEDNTEDGPGTLDAHAPAPEH